jgi:hypothetical protein
LTRSAGVPVPINLERRPVDAVGEDILLVAREKRVELQLLVVILR